MSNMTQPENVAGRPAAAVPQWDRPDRMRKALRVAGMTSRSMALYLEVEERSVTRWLNGVIEPKRGILAAWSLRTGVPMEWIETGAGVRTNRAKYDRLARHRPRPARPAAAMNVYYGWISGTGREWRSVITLPWDEARRKVETAVDLDLLVSELGFIETPAGVRASTSGRGSCRSGNA